ncbi:MAG: serpin family protein [Ruminococcus sp.]|nr:serpin family protein [Ruminococcus sp.]
MNGDGLTVGDAQAIQKKLLNLDPATIDIPSSMSTVRLDDKVNVQASEGKTVDEEFAAAEMNLGIELLKKSFAPAKAGEENLLISPMSVSAALAMTANGADGKTRSEMEKVLGNGLTLGQINEYMAYYLSKLPNNEKEKVYIADSIWFKDKPSFKVYEDFLEQNKKYYGAELYKAPFDDNTVTDINDWVSRNTNGMIPSILRNGDLEPTEEKEMLMMLLNTLYFEADWQQPYTHANNDFFTDINGEKRTIKSLVSKEYEYFDLGDADAFKKPYAGGNYSFVGILPRDNDIVEYVNDLDAEKLFDGLKECEDPESVDLYTMIPKFEYDYEKSLNDILKEMGMPTAFGGTADFSKINDLSVDGAQALWIDKVLHKTKIELNEKGTKAAAVTSVGLYGGGGMPDLKKEVFIYLNRPFVYMIVDKNNVPLFIGAATQLGEK